jgi:glycosyltransferase involved in cell wall biosynthesis
MQISFFVPRCTPDNSHGRYVLELARHLGSEHAVTIYSNDFWAPLRSVVRCRYVPVPLRPAVVRLAALWAASLVASRRQPADITHIQGADAPVGNVVTAHCCNPAMEAAESHGPSLRSRVNYAVGAAAEKFCISKRSTVRVIAVSGKVKDEIVREYGIEHGRIVVIPNGVDGDVFHPNQRKDLGESIRERLGLTPADFVLLFVGGDYYLKGLPTLLAAVQRLPHAIKVLVVGARPDSFMARLASQGSLNGSITFLGRRTDLVALYAASDCFVLPTKYDTFSLSTLEAMASGLPVIISRAAGVSELLTTERDSLLLENPESVEALAEGLGRIVRDETLRKNLGIEARKTAERYSWEMVTRRTLAVYQEVLRTRQ